MTKAVVMVAILVAAFALAAGISALVGWLFMLAWNFAAVSAFGAPALTFYQAWAIWFLLSLVGNTFRSATAREAKR